MSDLFLFGAMSANEMRANVIGLRRGRYASREDLKACARKACSMEQLLWFERTEEVVVQNITSEDWKETELNKNRRSRVSVAICRPCAILHSVCTTSFEVRFWGRTLGPSPEMVLPRPARLHVLTLDVNGR